MNYYNELYHHGILGMKWGVRRYQNKDGTLTPLGKRRLQREAQKDATEFARAKMYYGDGAGTRRKLIKAKVEQKSKDPYYKSEFDRALSGQDMAKRAAEARSKRHREDVKATTAKTARGIVNVATGNAARAGAAVAATYGVLRVTGLDRKIIDYGRQYAEQIIRKVRM